MDMAPPKGYLAMGSSMQKLPGGATAVVHSLQQPDLSSVLSDEPDMTGCGTSEVSLLLLCVCSQDQRLSELAPHSAAWCQQSSVLWGCLFGGERKRSLISAEITPIMCISTAVKVQKGTPVGSVQHTSTFDGWPCTAQDMRIEDDSVSVGTALGQDYEAPTLATRCSSPDGASYVSSQSSESGLKGRPGSPDSPLLWAGGLFLPLFACHLLPLPMFSCRKQVSAIKLALVCTWACPVLR